MRLSAFAFLLLGLVLSSCGPTRPVVIPGPRYIEDLAYDSCIARNQRIMEEKFKARDNSYILSVMSWAITCFYGRRFADAKKGFTAACRLDDNDIAEAAKVFQWLIVDQRTVYRLTKRERELCHFYLGLAYLLNNDLGGSLVEFRKLRQRDQEASQLPAVNFYMGLVYEKLDKTDDALIEYKGLVQMNRYPDAPALVRRLEQPDEPPDTITEELIVHVDHQTLETVARTEVYADDALIGTLVPAADNFDVKLTQAEANRKAAQEAGAAAARFGLRLLGALAGEALLGKGGANVADAVADITLGKESENRDLRAWGYAPVALSFLRTRVPRQTGEVKLVFYKTGGGMLGSCRYPLTGQNTRVIRAAGMNFVIAGLSPEFYVYP
uniref:Tetratricopeptide repeat protein n=1 Tax=candidate division WOR-3 bacterium TaxID=2052148 RepID=A0A7C4GAC3_UNCW3